ncbi:MAG: F0F1 ATP synthase subunit delta, partial [Candidatus Omnitrophica bacterium]|nr:F0F1 ATP synthase subunit delta [Candidatus Omnitrophota bacterium]
RTRRLGGETVAVLLRTTYPLESDQILMIRDRIAGKIGKKMNFFTRYDPSLLGGVQLVIGNTVMDGSVKRRIEDLRARLMKARV